METHHRLHVLVAGAGVAGVETLLALHHLAEGRVALTLLAPEADFTYRPMAVAEPFGLGRAHHRLALDRVARDCGAALVTDALEAVDARARTATTAGGRTLRWDALVLALGAGVQPALERVLTWTPDADPERFGGVLRDLDEGYARRVAFVAPPGCGWTLPAYELALLTARAAWSMGRDDVEVSLVTAEGRPLELFGPAASHAVAELLDAAGVRFRGGAYPERRPGRLVLRPGRRVVATDRVVALPRAAGRPLPGVPADRDGFLRCDVHGRVAGIDRVWAAGDGTAFPVKQGGLSTQQADAVAESIAALAGVAIEPRPFRPVLRGLLLTGDGGRWMTTAVAGGGGEGRIAAHALWWPPAKIAGRHLSPYLARAEGDPRPAHLDLTPEWAARGGMIRPLTRSGS